MSGFSTTQVLAPSVARPTEPKPTTAVDRALDSSGSTDILNVSVTGKLVGIAINVKGGPSGTPSAKLKINIDAQGFEDVLLLYSAATTWTDAAKGYSIVGDGDAVDDRLILWLHVDFAVSCQVALETTSAGSAGTLTGTAIYSQVLP